MNRQLRIPASVSGYFESPALFIKNLQPPTAVDDFYELAVNEKRYISSHMITDNDISPFGDSKDLNVELLSDVTNGKLEPYDKFRKFIYTPNENFTGTDAFTYRVRNEKYTSNVATVTLNIRPTAITDLKNESSANISIYPNPVSDELNIQFELKVADKITIDVYDLTGQKIANVFNAELGIGIHEISWNTESATGVSLQPGLYVFHFEGDSIKEQHKVIIK